MRQRYTFISSSFCWKVCCDTRLCVTLYIAFYHLKTEFRLDNIYKFVSYLTEDIPHLGYKTCQMIIFKKILDFFSPPPKKINK